MSVMTKFLKQTCSFEAARRDGELTLLSEHGDILYKDPEILKCRREKYARDIQTPNGSIVKTSSRYMLDESVEVQVDDRLDGHVVLACEEYIDHLGKCVGYEAYV